VRFHLSTSLMTAGTAVGPVYPGPAGYAVHRSRPSGMVASGRIRCSDATPWQAVPRASVASWPAASIPRSSQPSD